MMIQRILFIELLGGIGDVVIALPAIQALKRSHPAAHLTVLTFAPGSELLETDPLINRVLVAPKGEARQTVDRLLAAEPFDLVVSDTTYDGIATAIETWGNQSSHRPRWVTNLWRSPPPDQLVSDRFLQILTSEGLISSPHPSHLPFLHLPAHELQQAQQTLGAAFRPLVFLCPDAGMAIKRWSADAFVQVGQALQRQTGATIVVIEGADRAEAEQLAGAIGGTARIWERGRLRQLAAAIAAGDLLIAADTGVARMAAALNVPTITLFGPSWQGRYGQPVPHINLQGFPHCPERNIANFTEQACWYSGDCPFEWRTCLEDLTPDRVLEAAIPLLKKRATPFPSLPALGDLGDRKSINPEEIRNLLLMRLDNMGDVIMTSPAVLALRQAFPQARMTFMASPAGAFAANLLPGVDEVLSWRVLWQDLGRLDFDPDREWQFIETLKSRQFDAAIIFTSFSQSPHPAGLICEMAGIPIRVGESKEQDRGTLTHALPPAPDEIHQVDRNLRLIESIGVPVSSQRLTLNIPETASQAVLPFPYLLLNPWTTCPSRNYDVDRLAIAAKRLSDLTGWRVAVTGVEKDWQRSRSLMATLGDRAVDLIGKTQLAELVALICNAELVLTNNTSTMHIADATETPMVVLFAGTELECQWQPRFAPTRLLRRPTVCSPCYAFTCPYELQCLDISPETIVAAGLELLQTRKIPSAFLT